MRALRFHEGLGTNFQYLYFWLGLRGGGLGLVGGGGSFGLTLNPLTLNL